jgi:hypothetical protein
METVSFKNKSATKLGLCLSPGFKFLSRFLVSSTGILRMTLHGQTAIYHLNMKRTFLVLLEILFLLEKPTGDCISAADATFIHFKLPGHSKIPYLFCFS